MCFAGSALVSVDIEVAHVRCFIGWQGTSEPGTLRHPGEPSWLRRLARGGEVRDKAANAFRKLHNFAFSLQFECDLIFS